MATTSRPISRMSSPSYLPTTLQTPSPVRGGDSRAPVWVNRDSYPTPDNTPIRRDPRSLPCTPAPRGLIQESSAKRSFDAAFIEHGLSDFATCLPVGPHPVQTPQKKRRINGGCLTPNSEVCLPVLVQKLPGIDTRLFQPARHQAGSIPRAREHYREHLYPSPGSPVAVKRHHNQQSPYPSPSNSPIRGPHVKHPRRTLHPSPSPLKHQAYSNEPLVYQRTVSQVTPASKYSYALANALTPSPSPLHTSATHASHLDNVGSVGSLYNNEQRADKQQVRSTPPLAVMAPVRRRLSANPASIQDFMATPKPSGIPECIWEDVIPVSQIPKRVESRRKSQEDSQLSQHIDLTKSTASDIDESMMKDVLTNFFASNPPRAPGILCAYLAMSSDTMLHDRKVALLKECIECDPQEVGVAVRDFINESSLSPQQKVGLLVPLSESMGAGTGEELARIMLLPPYQAHD